MDWTEKHLTEGAKAPDTTFDKVSAFFALGLASLGIVAYSGFMFTEADRISRNPWEDGIVLGFLYSLLTGLGALRFFKPKLPRWFHLASALANVVVGHVIVMFWVSLFTGKIYGGALLVPPVGTLVYVVVLRGIRVREHFAPYAWLVVVAIICSALSLVIPEALERSADNLSDLNQVSKIAGAIYIVTALTWITLVVVGFWRRRSAEQEQLS